MEICLMSILLDQLNSKFYSNTNRERLHTQITFKLGKRFFLKQKHIKKFRLSKEDSSILLLPDNKIITFCSNYLNG